MSKSAFQGKTIGAQAAGINYVGTDGSDAAFGTANDDTMNGLSGNDSLNAGAGNDTVLGGDGNDQLYGESGNDKVYGGAGDDFIEGHDGNDMLDGGLGNDYLIGGSGNDSYSFGFGSGHDLLNNDDSIDGAGVDKIVLRSGVTANDLVFLRAGLDLIIRIEATGEQVTVWQHFAGARFAIDRVQFADGTSLSQAVIESRLGATQGDDIIWGAPDADVFHGLRGNDQLQGSGGNDKLYGDAGNDFLDGSDGNDTLDGGTGDDHLMGGVGNDNYIFGLGYGHDTIHNVGNGAVDTDRITLGAGISADDVVLYRYGDDLVLVLETGDQLTVMQNFSGPDGIDTIKFADGSSWSQADILARLGATRGDDNVYGTMGDDVLNGFAGNDTLYAQAGNDKLYGGSGYDFLDGFEGNDVLDGGSGDDMLMGGAGSDSYVFGFGYGRDMINNYGPDAGAGVDKIALAAGVLPEDVILYRTGDDLVLAMPATGDQITVASHFSGADYAIDRITFDDGTSWSQSYITSILGATQANDILYDFFGYDTINGLGGNDMLHGQLGNDILNGGRGSDVLFGEEGADKFVFQDQLEPMNVDTIADFEASDTIRLDNAIFKKLGVTTGAMAAKFFVANEGGFAMDDNDCIVYDTTSGNLYYDADGNAPGAKVLFAVVGAGTHPTLTASDFVVI